MGNRVIRNAILTILAGTLGGMLLAVRYGRRFHSLARSTPARSSTAPKAWFDGSALAGQRQPAVTPPAPQAGATANWPIQAGDVFVTLAPKDGSVLYMWEDRLYEWPRRRELRIPREAGGADYAHWSPDGARLILGNKEMALVIDYRHFRIVKRYDYTICAWWEGSAVATIDEREQPFRGFPPQRVRIGRRSVPLPAHVEVTASTDDGALLLARVQSRSADAEHRNNVIVLRRRGVRWYPATGRLLPQGTLLDNPYGELIVSSPDHQQIVFGLCTTTMRDNTYVWAYYYDLARHRLRPISILRKLSWAPGSDSAMYATPPVLWCAGGFGGILRQAFELVDRPPMPPRFYRFREVGGRVVYRGLDHEVIGCATCGTRGDAACIERTAAGIFLDVRRGGRRTAHLQLDPRGRALGDMAEGATPRGQPSHMAPTPWQGTATRSGAR